MSKKYIILFSTVASALIFVATAFFWKSDNANVPNSEQEIKNSSKATIQSVKIGEQVLKIELADTPAERERGLSGREHLAEDEGMLFVFDTPGRPGFWMKDMNFSIDMIWIGEDFHILYIKKDARPDSYPEIFSPEEDAKYVLETVSGFSEKNNIGVGDKVEFLP